ELSFTADRARYRLAIDKSQVLLSSESGTRVVEVTPCSQPAIEHFKNQVGQIVSQPKKKITEIGRIPATSRIDVQMDRKEWHTTKGTDQGLFLLRIKAEFERLAFDVWKACR